MLGRHDLMLAIVAALGVIGAVAAFVAPARAGEEGPLVIAKQGYFFAGGRIDTTIEGSPMVGHMYVEYQIPEKLEHPYPVVMIHGGSQTGTNFTGTPDGREGWAQHFLRKGYAVYVVDQVARGRAAHWSNVHGPVTPPRLNFVEQRFVGPERFKLWPQAHLHTQWPECVSAARDLRSAARCVSRKISWDRCGNRYSPAPLTGLGGVLMVRAENRRGHGRRRN